MEAFESPALQSAPLKPSFYERYVYYSFLVWPHGEPKLQEFVGFLNSHHQNIQFTVEVEKKWLPSFSGSMYMYNKYVYVENLIGH